MNGFECSAKDDLLKVREWLLAILRFAITLQAADRTAALTMAESMDRLGANVALASFDFFVRTSIAFRDGIAAGGDPEKTAALRRQLKRIEDEWLRRAFEAVLGEGLAKPRSGRPRTPERNYLFRGLPSR